jgi:hypothetical protein
VPFKHWEKLQVRKLLNPFLIEFSVAFALESSFSNSLVPITTNRLQQKIMFLTLIAKLIRIQVVCSEKLKCLLLLSIWNANILKA